MTKQEFLEKMKTEKPLEEYLIEIEVDELIDSPDIIGCYKANGKWKVYETEERGGYFIIDEFTNEDEAFDFLYKLVYVIKKRNDYVKQQGL